MKEIYETNDFQRDFDLSFFKTLFEISEEKLEQIERAILIHLDIEL